MIEWMTIVGVAGDVRDEGLVTDPGPLLYVPYLQDNTPTARVSLVVRTQSDPTQLAKSVREAIWEIDRNQPIDRVASLEDVFLEGASAERFRTLLVGLFAFSGLTLAIIGVTAFYVLGRPLSGLLYQTSAADPSVIVGAALTMIVLALLAAGWQSRRLAKVSPAVGLRG